MSHTSPQWQLRTLYREAGVEYSCPRIGHAVAPDCFYSLQTEPGGEGQLFAGSCCVRCAHADDCPHLPKGRCPLTVGLGEVLNSLKVRVLHGVRHLVIGDDDHTSLTAATSYTASTRPCCTVDALKHALKNSQSPPILPPKSPATEPGQPPRRPRPPVAALEDSYAPGLRCGKPSAVGSLDLGHGDPLAG